LGDQISVLATLGVWFGLVWFVRSIAAEGNTEARGGASEDDFECVWITRFSSPCASCPVSQTGKRGAAGVHVTPKPRNEAAEEIHYVHHSKYSSSSDALSSSFVAFTALG